MATIEKTIKGLECCSLEPERLKDCRYRGCPYSDLEGKGEFENFDCVAALSRDALSLLKAQVKKEKECEKCAQKTSAATERLQEQLKEKRDVIKELTKDVLNNLMEAGKLIPPMVLSVDDMQAIEEGQFLWIEVRGDNLYCVEAVQVCKANGKVSEISFTTAVSFSKMDVISSLETSDVE